jgi:hypothetical protein
VLTTYGFGSDLYEVSGKVINSVTKAPAKNIKIIIAPQVEEGEYCVFDTAISSITNESGEFSIINVPKGKYFIFFGSAHDSINMIKKAQIPTSTNKLMIAHDLQTNNKLKEPVKALEGGRMMIKDGQLSIHGYLYIQSLNLLVFSNEGLLQNIDITSNTKDLVLELKPRVIK